MTGFVLGLLFLPVCGPHLYMHALLSLSCILSCCMYTQETLRRTNDSTPVPLQEPSDDEALMSSDSSSSTASLHKHAIASPDETPTGSTSLTKEEHMTLLEKFQSLIVVRLLCRRKVLISVLLYCVLGFADVMFENVFPMWAMNEVRTCALSLC